MPTVPDLVPPSDRVRERIAKLDRMIEIYRAEIEGPQPDPFHEDGAHSTDRVQAILRDLIEQRDSLRKELCELPPPQ